MSETDLGRLFETFTVSAFRLEGLPFYAVTEDGEREAFRCFKNNDSEPPPSWSKDREWCATVRRAVARGAIMRRVRWLDNYLTDYQRFQLDWSYPYNEEAGEQIFVMEDSAVVAAPVYEHDFWLFDDATVVLLDYDKHGNFLGVKSVDDVERYCRLRDSWLANAMTLSHYRGQYPIKTKRGRTADHR